MIYFATLLVCWLALLLWNQFHKANPKNPCSLELVRLYLIIDMTFIQSKIQIKISCNSVESNSKPVESNSKLLGTQSRQYHLTQNYQTHTRTKQNRKVSFMHTMPWLFAHAHSGQRIPNLNCKILQICRIHYDAFQLYIIEDTAFKIALLFTLQNKTTT